MPGNPIHPIAHAWILKRLPLSPPVLQTLSEDERAFHDALLMVLQARIAPEGWMRCESLVQRAEETGNVQLEMLAYMQWALASAFERRVKENAVLLKRIDAMVDDSLPEELRIAAMYNRFLSAEMLGSPRTMQMLRRVLKAAAPGSALWQNGCFSLLYRSAAEGTLRGRGELQSLFEASCRKDGFPSYALIPFVNAVQTGDLAAAIPRLPQVRALYAEEGLLSVYGVHRVMIEFMMHHVPAAWPEPEVAYEEDARRCFAEGEIRLDTFMMTTRHLLAGRVEEALEAARGYAADLGSRFFSILRFDGYDMVRAELAAGYTDGATAMLRKRFEHGVYGWLDNFFLARIARLKGKAHLAEAEFRRTLGVARHYRAENRLLFEFALACELPAATLLRWSSILIRNLPTSTEPPAGVPGTIQRGGKVPARPLPSDAGFVGVSPAAVSIQARIREYARLDPPVLLVGETGTGKELVARQLHEGGARRGYPFTAVNCAAMSPSLLQSELFGHVRGAFTGAVRSRAGLFETAANGTLLLDEIGDMTREVQAAFLRVLETRLYRPLGSDKAYPVRCRILTATNRDLWEAIRARSFREDLFYRISGLTLSLPPLRERPEDIYPLTMHFLRMFHPRPATCGLAPDLHEAFLGYGWPGNVRQLRGVVENLCLLFAERDVYTYGNLTAVVPDWEGMARSAPLSHSRTETGTGAGRESEPEERMEPPSSSAAPEGGGAHVSWQRADTLDENETAAGVPDSAAGGTEPPHDEAGEQRAGADATRKNDKPQAIPPGNGHATPMRKDTTPTEAGVTGGSAEYVVPPRPEDAISSREKLVACFAHHKRLRRKDILVMIGISHTTATNLLRTLVEEGVIRKVMPNRSPRTHYFEYRG